MKVISTVQSPTSRARVQGAEERPIALTCTYLLQTPPAPKLAMNDFKSLPYPPLFG
jgi:hypothetical protein